MNVGIYNTDTKLLSIIYYTPRNIQICSQLLGGSHFRKHTGIFCYLYYTMKNKDTFAICINHRNCIDKSIILVVANLPWIGLCKSSEVQNVRSIVHDQIWD